MVLGYARYKVDIDDHIVQLPVAELPRVSVPIATSAFRRDNAYAQCRYTAVPCSATWLL